VRGGVIASSQRRGAIITNPPISDTFSTTFSTTNWAGNSYGVSTVSGRLRIPCTSSYPQAETAAVFDINLYALWIELPTVPVAGNGTTQTHFAIENSGRSSLASFNLSGAPLSIAMQLTGSSTTFLTYNATNHRWLRFRLLSGNLLWEVSPDKITWTQIRTIAAPAWATAGSLRVLVDSSYYGTETAPGNAEFDNFNV